MAANPVPKDTVSEANVGTITEYLGGSYPSQADYVPTSASGQGVDENVFVGHEAKGSRRIQADFKSGVIVHVHLFRGRTDQIANGGIIQDMIPGEPHPWATSNDVPSNVRDMYKHFYLENITFQQHVSQTRTSASSDDGPWTKVTTTYRRQQDPRVYLEEWSAVSAMYGEWYERGAPVPESELTSPVYGTVYRSEKMLTGTLNTFNVPRPQPIYRRFYPKVKLSKAKRLSIEMQVGHVNGLAFQGQTAEYWFFESASIRPIYGVATDEDKICTVTLSFRGDPWRRHRFWWPGVQFIGAPDEPGPDDFWTPLEGTFVGGGRSVHQDKKLYTSSDKDWDSLVPLWGQE